MINSWLNARTFFVNHGQYWALVLLNILLIFLILSTLWHQGQNIFNVIQNFKVQLPEQHSAANQFSEIKNIQLANYHLLGVPTVTPSEPQKWQLLGIISGDQIDKSIVILSTGKNEELLYRLGDVLPDGAKIVDIGSDKIKLRHNGSTEELTIAWQEEDSIQPLQTSNVD